MNFKTVFCAAAVSAITSFSANSAVLIDWDFSSLDWTPTGGSGLALNDPAPNPVLPSSAANAAAGLSTTDLTPSGTPAGFTNGLAIVVNATTAPGEADLRDFDFGGNGTNENFLEFTITGDSPGSLNIDSISISQWRNGAGAPDGMAFDVSIDGGAYALYAPVQQDTAAGSGPSFDTFTFSQAITNASTVGIRFTPRNVAAGSTGNIHVNGIQVNGTVIPEPSSLALFALGGLALLRRSRRS